MRRLIELVILTNFSLVSSAFGQIATAIHINANSGRPLAEATEQLERQVGIAINYEDIPYAFSGDIVDNTEKALQALTSEQRAAVRPGFTVLGPRGGQLVFDSNNPVRSIDDVSSILNQLVGLSVANGFPGAYSVSFENGAFSVTPVQMRNVSGASVPVTSVLDTPVSFPSEQRTLFKALEAILSQVKQNRGFKIGLGIGPAMTLVTTQTNIGAANEPARNVIARLFFEIAPGTALDGSPISRLSYELRFDAKNKDGYGMTIKTVPNLAQPKPHAPPAKKGPIGPYIKKKQ